LGFVADILHNLLNMDPNLAGQRASDRHHHLKSSGLDLVAALTIPVTTPSACHALLPVPLLRGDGHRFTFSYRHRTLANRRLGLAIRETDRRQAMG
jgi:hypothetical protein